MFDFVNPLLAVWWLIDQGWKLRLDEPKSGREYASMDLTLKSEEARTV